MEYLFGLILTIDDQCGSKALASLLWSLPQTGNVDPLQLYEPAQELLAGNSSIKRIRRPAN
jgi:hypothetical protein